MLSFNKQISYGYKKNFSLNIFLISIFILGLFTNVFGAKDKNVNLSTHEYPNYRRFIITIPGNIDIEKNSILMPQIDLTPTSGEFKIIIKSENVKKFEGERIRKDEGEIPIRFVLSYPDENTLQITGKTIQYKDLNGFYILGKQQYVFDISTEDLNQNGFYNNSVKLLENDQNPNLTNNNEVSEKKSFTILQKKSKQSNQGNTNLVAQSLKTALMIFAAISFLVIATLSILKIYNGEKIFKRKMRSASVIEEKPEKIIKEDTLDFDIPVPKKSSRKKINYYNNDTAINALVYDKRERKIRILMNKKQLNYDEAEMLLNLSKSNFHA